MATSGPARTREKSTTKMPSSAAATRAASDLEPAHSSRGSRRRAPRRSVAARSLPEVDAALGGVAVDLGQLLVRETEILQRAERIVELLDARRADQGRGHPRVAQRPGKRE